MKRHWSDAEMLFALDAMERRGLSAAQCAAELARRFGVARGRSAVLGMIKRVREDLGRLPDECTRPENRDGGMPELWWVDGLRAQARRAA